MNRILEGEEKEIGAVELPGDPVFGILERGEKSGLRLYRKSLERHSSP